MHIMSSDVRRLDSASFHSHHAPVNSMSSSGKFGLSCFPRHAINHSNQVLTQSCSRLYRISQPHVQDITIMANPHTEVALASLASLFNSGSWSDCTIKCGSTELKCHRAIICARSAFFERAFGGQFQVFLSTFNLSEGFLTPYFRRRLRLGVFDSMTTIRTRLSG